MNIGERIKDARNKKKYTQQQLADIIGVKRAAIHKYEKNLVSPSVEMLEKIADALGTRPNLLLYDENDLYDDLTSIIDIGAPFNERIIECRLKSKISQENLAYNVGLSVDDIKNIENGTMAFPIELLPDFADALNTPIEYLRWGDKKLDKIKEIASKLNDKGKDKVIDYATDLSEQDKYTKPDEPEE